MAPLAPSMLPNLLTFLLGEPNSLSLQFSGTEDPPWFSTDLKCLVSAKSEGTTFHTFQNLKRLVKSFASGLRQAGFANGDRLLAITPENIDLPIVMLGTIAAGGVFLCQRPSLTIEEQAAAMKHYEPSFVLAYEGSENATFRASRLADIEIRLYLYGDNFSQGLPASHLMGRTFLPDWTVLLDRTGSDTFQWMTFRAPNDSETSALITFTSR